MGTESARSWEELRRQRPLNEHRVDTYRQLMKSQELLGAMRGVDVGQAAVDAALEASLSLVPESESDEELYIGTLTRYVEALGGRLEVLGDPPSGVRAGFPGWSIALPRSEYGPPATSESD
jgi:hypothetical protein